MKQYISKAVKKYNSLPIPLRASFFFVFCGVFKDAVDVISTPIFTRLLTTEEYGLFNVYNSWYQILRLLFTINIVSDSFSVGFAKFGDNKKRYISSQQGLATTVLIFWSLIVIPLRNLLSGMMGIETQFIFLMLAQALFSVSYYSWFQEKRYVYSYKILTAVTVLYTLSQPLLGIIVIKLNTTGFNNGYIRIYTGVGMQIVFGLVFLIINFINSRNFFDKDHWRFSLKLNIPLIPHHLSQILLNQSDKLMIDAFAGKSYTAIYSVSHAAAFVLQAITNNLNATLVPWLYEKLKKKNYDNIRKTVSGLVILAAIIVAALVLVAPEAMKILASDEYHDGIWIIPPLAFSVFLIFVYLLFSNIEMFYEKSVYILISSLVGAGSNILLNYLFIPRLGYYAAGYTTVVGYILMCICHMIFTIITCKQKNVPFGKLFDVKLICIVSVILAAVCAGIMSIYNYTVLRYALLLLIVAILLVKRKMIITLIKDIRKKKSN